MKRYIGRDAALLIVAAAGIVLTGCVTPQKPLYYWGDYQRVVYSHFKGEGPEAQQIKLEQTAHRAQSQGQPVPPGFNAHLGLLYVNTGQLDRAIRAFEAESALYPESKPYMDFLLAKFTTKLAGDAR